MGEGLERLELRVSSTDMGISRNPGSQDRDHKLQSAHTRTPIKGTPNLWKQPWPYSYEGGEEATSERHLHHGLVA